MTTIRFSGRTPSPREITIGQETDASAEKLRFRLPQISASQTATLQMILPDGTPEAVIITDGEITVPATMTAQAGRTRAWVEILGANTTAWHSELFYLDVGELPPISEAVEMEWPTAFQQVLAGTAADKAAAAGSAAEAAGSAATLQEVVAVLRPEASQDDIGKYLRVKNVANGAVTEYEYNIPSGGGSGGTSDYAELDNKPKINNITLSGNKSLNDLGIASEEIVTKKGTYVTPEEFGAKGDGSTDDATALLAALEYGRTNKVSVRGFKRYVTSSPLTISGTYRDVFLNIVSYTGNDYGLIVKGSYHTIRLMQLYCANGGGVLYQADTSNISWVNFQANRVFAHNHAVNLQTSNNRLILYNTFNIRAVKSDTGNCYNANERAGENVYYNSSCTCGAGWAIYCCGGRYYNFTLEADVLNGIYANAGDEFIGFRHREMCDKLIYRINGTNPDAQGGTLIKFAGIYKTPVKYISEDPIPYAAIDVSDMTTLDDILDAAYPVMADVTALTRYSVIDAPIRYGNWDTLNGNFVLGKQMIVAGGRKICVPAFETVYTITDADFDMRDAQVLADNAKPYPTKMIIGVDNCVVHLPTSYCPYGYSEFIVDQTSHTCTIYDCNSSVTPVFNGSQLGKGVYRLTAFCDTLDNAVTNNTPQKIMNINDTKNFIWKIERIVSDTGITNVADFGAVGDGVTDDSAAIQNAVNAGYKVYFESDKTYYIPTTVNITHDVHLYGGKNTKIITKTPTGGTLNNVFAASGTLKKTTTLTTDYASQGNTANSGNKFTLADMAGISIDDIMVITATDQYYNYSRTYYYLGATLLIGDIYDGHLYTTSGMPFDIELTANVTVEIYSAPVVTFENLHFEADMDSHGNYRHFILLQECRNSVIKNCSFTQMDCGISISKCVNTMIDSIEMSKSEETEIAGDGYGLYIGSSSNTVVQRVMAICSQAGISLSGTIPNIDTFIRYCQLGSECRRHGIATHENSYNTVVEDCTLSGLNILGTGTVNRCRFINNKRQSGDGGITFCGSHNPDYAILRINDCVFESNNGLYVYPSSVQNPIQAFDNIVGLIEIKNCRGGQLNCDGQTSQYILSNRIMRLDLSGWLDCNEIYKMTSDVVIEKISVADCTFRKKYWINNHNNAIYLENVYDLEYRTTFPMQHKISVNKDTYGERYTLPENVKINLSAANSTTAKYIVCGNNLASNDPDDYEVGSVSGSDGGTLTRTPSTASSKPTITNDASGNIVFTQQGNTNNFSMYPVGMFYAKEAGSVKMSAKIKSESAVSFRPYIAIVDCGTGNLVSRYAGTAVEATSAGASITYSHSIDKNCVAMCYYYCSTPVSSAATTFEEMKTTIESIFVPATDNSLQPYEARRLTGDGSILSLPGANNIMSSEDVFHVTFGADYVENPVGVLPVGAGVNF